MKETKTQTGDNHLINPQKQNSVVFSLYSYNGKRLHSEASFTKSYLSVISNVGHLCHYPLKHLYIH